MKSSNQNNHNGFNLDNIDFRIISLMILDQDNKQISSALDSIKYNPKKNTQNIGIRIG